MALPAAAGLSWWYILIVSAAVLAGTVIVYLPFLRRGKLRKQAEEQQRQQAGTKVTPAAAAQAEERDDDGRPLIEEPWVPKFEVRQWREAAQWVGCPWHFDNCGSVEDALERIWRKPLHYDLQQAFEALAERVKDLQVARVQRANEVYWAIVYNLKSGAELFGGEPVEHNVGLDLGGDEQDDGGDDSHMELLDAGGLRRRRGPGSPQSASPHSEEESAVPFPSLLPFYRVHDGFGVLLQVKHLPLLMSDPEDVVAGSTFYVYPVRGFEPIAKRSHLVRFARVDKACVVCLDARRDGRSLVYLERSGEEFEDDEHPMSFIGDTVRNICGQRVVPPSYLGGPSAVPTGTGGGA